MKKIGWCNRAQGIENWRHLHIEELRDSYFSSNIISATKSKNMRRWASSTHGTEVHTGFWWKNLKKKNYVEDTRVEGKIK